jgi:probable F420-dependent oxidoreductase
VTLLSAIEEAVMLVDGGCYGGLTEVGADAQRLEQLGYDCINIPEVAHDGLMPLPIAAQATTRIGVGTSILVAFSRTPMTMAAATWDVQAYSRGRLIVGLGSQIKPHIERRFSMPWSAPAARMREYVLAMRAIWDTWQNGTKLDFRGDFYTHTLMTPMFEPGRLDGPPPPIHIAAVGALMTATAAEVADGLLLHAFTTTRYVREVTMPMVEKGLADAGRTRADIAMRHSPFLVWEAEGPKREESLRVTRERIAFYGSTPAYRGVFELHGWGDLQTELQAMSKRGEWTQMGTIIDEDVLNAFAIVSDPDHLADDIIAEIGDLADRVSLQLPADADADWQSEVVRKLQAAPAPTR